MALAGTVAACGGDGDGGREPEAEDTKAVASAGFLDRGVQPVEAALSEASVGLWPGNVPTRRFAWAQLIPGAGDQVVMTVAPDDSLFIAADHDGRIDFGEIQLDAPRGEGIVVLKLTADATPIWGRSFDGADDVYVQDIAVTAEGGVVVAGVFEGGTFDLGLGTVPSAGREDGFLARLDGDTGSTEWVKSFATRSSDDTVAAIEAATDGSLYVYGHLGSDVEIDGEEFGRGAFLARYGGDGTRLWAHSFAGANPSWQGPMALDRWRGPVIAGRFCCTLELGDDLLTVDPGESFEGDIFVAGFDFDGNVRFARQIVDESWAQPRSIAFAPSGDFYVAGHNGGGQLVVDGRAISSADSSDDLLLLRLTAEGKYRWSTSVHGEFANDARGVTVDALGAVYTTFKCTAPVHVEPAIPCKTLYGNVIVSYGPDNEYRFATYVEPAWVQAILPAPDGRLYVAGDANFGRSVSFGGVRIEERGLFVASLITDDPRARGRKPLLTCSAPDEMNRTSSALACTTADWRLAVEPARPARPRPARPPWAVTRSSLACPDRDREGPLSLP